MTETATESQPEADKFVEATDAAVAAAFDDDRTDESVPSSERESDRELPEATDAVVAAAFGETRRRATGVGFDGNRLDDRRVTARGRRRQPVRGLRRRTARGRRSDDADEWNWE
ncbi:hypothetical protein D8S78_19380 [Natrialba swarupiae]|nr:hypothetical protein [Natrialba swarupiae]